MLLFGYEAMLEWVDSQLPDAGGPERRVDLEVWWGSLSLLFGSPLGRGVLAMRSLEALHNGEHQLEELELERLRRFRRWCAAPTEAVLSCWSLVRVSGNPMLSAEQRLRLREMRGSEQDAARVAAARAALPRRQAGYGVEGAPRVRLEHITIKNMVLFTREVVESKLNDRIREAFL